MPHKVFICNIDTSQIPKLKQNEIVELIEKIKNGDKESANYFVLCNLRLVLSLVQRFKNKGNSDDLFQVGCVGLLKAVKNFDTSYNVCFSTYAVPMIIGEIRRFLRDANSLKVSRSIRDTAYKALRAKEEIENKTQRQPSILEIAEEIEMSAKEVACALDAVSEPRSLYEATYSDGDENLLLMEQLSDDRHSAEIWGENIELHRAIRTLSDKERKILELRYFIGKTQVEISNEIGVSQAQISRLEKNALQKIKKII